MQGGKSLTNGLKRIAKGGDFIGGEKNTTDPDINKETKLELHYCPTADWCKTNLPEKFIVLFPAGKKIYIKLHENKLVPQQGNVLGLTTKLYSIKGNIEPKDMFIVEGKTKKTALGIELPTMAAKQKVTGQPIAVSAQTTELESVGKQGVTGGPIEASAQTTELESVGKQKTLPQTGLESAPKQGVPGRPIEASAQTVEVSNIQETQDPEEMAWQQFPEANKFRKSDHASLNETDPMALELARKIFSVTASSPVSEIKKTYHKFALEFHPDRGTTKLSKDVKKIAFDIISSAHQALLSNGNFEPQRQLVILLKKGGQFDGQREFMAPLYQKIKNTFNKTSLMDVQNKISARQGVPEWWRNMTLEIITKALKGK